MGSHTSVMKRAKPSSLAAFIAEHQNYEFSKFMRDVNGPFLLCSSQLADGWILDLGAHDFVTERPITLGRDPKSCEAVIPSQSVSRVHASINATKNGWSIHDLGSRNGLFVNGKRLPAHTSQLLPTGASITLGKKARLCFLDSASLYFSVLSPSMDQERPSDLDRSVQFFEQFKDKSQEFSLEDFIENSADYGFQDYLQSFKAPVLVRLQSDILDESSSGEQTGKLRRMTKNIFAKGAFWTLGGQKDEFIMGRDIQSDIVLGGPRVSRRHACIRKNGENWEIENLSSTESTKISDRVITESRTLFDEDLIRLGRSCLLQYMTPTSFWKFTRMYLKITNF